MQTSVDHLIEQSLGYYRIEQLLGRGKVNAVYIARHIERGETVMLTAFIIPPEFSSDARVHYLRRFEQVMSALKALDHPHILPVYESGEQWGYPYMVTPLVTSGSLARTLKQQERVSPTQALAILKQVADALDYANSKGMQHGILKPLNIMLDDALNVRMAGFGLSHILEMRGIEPVDGPYAHLYSVAHTFLGAPEYIAPEVVLGSPVNARSDIYSLGIILFEMLTGKVPFSGLDPLAVAMMHVQQPMPAIKAVYSEIPVALDLVVQRALERDPGKRYQSAGQLGFALERVMQVIEKAKNPPPPAIASNFVTIQGGRDGEKTLPPAVSFFNGISNDKEISNLSQSQRLTAMNARSSEMPRNTSTLPMMNDMGNWQIVPPIITSSLPAIKPPATAQLAQPAVQWSPVAVSPKGKEPFAEMVIDPFVWASTASIQAPRQLDKAAEQSADQQPGTFKKLSLGRRRSPRPLSPEGSPNKGRRKTVALLAGGGVAMIGLLGVGGIGLARVLQQPKQTQVAHNPPATAPAQKMGTKPNAKKQTTAKTKNANQPNQPNKPKATHTGTVIGASNMAAGSSKVFTNPTDGKESLLVHLSNGNFVAYERACTHQGVAVNYDAASGHLICPLHHSVFDPAKNGSVLVGPADTPLPTVAVRVNADGTVTTG